jgi:hypothetical protein
MTNTAIDFRTLPINVPSLCIPRVFPNINEDRIRGIFNSLDMGDIEKLDIVPKKTEKGEKFNRVFIHFRRWNTGGNADKARERLLNGKEIKIIYDDPWFWKISAYRERERKPFKSSDRFKSRERKPAVPRLQFDDDNNDHKKTDTKPCDHYNRGRKENDDRKQTILFQTNNDEEQYHREVVEKEEIKIDYGNLPAPKKFKFKDKKVTIKENKEEGEEN